MHPHQQRPHFRPTCHRRHLVYRPQQIHKTSFVRYHVQMQRGPKRKLGMPRGEQREKCKEQQTQMVEWRRDGSQAYLHQHRGNHQGHQEGGRLPPRDDSCPSRFPRQYTYGMLMTVMTSCPAPSSLATVCLLTLLSSALYAPHAYPLHH